MPLLSDAIAAASAIHGWCEPDELAYLGSCAAIHHCIVEVGCWQGRSAKVMALMTPGELHCIDDFRGAGGVAANGWIGPGGFPLGVGDTDPAALEAIFRANLADELASGKVIAPGIGSPEAASSFATGQVDMVYIDGDHDTDPVIEDLRAWRAVLAPGGLLCGHDGPDPRVQAALEHEGIEYDMVATNIWAAR